MRITIHQPEHMPWLGFFHKIAQVDTFVILDNVQFRKNYYQNRNKIRTSEGWSWVTVPVHHSLETLIRDVIISNDLRWRKKWRDSIWHAYKKAKYFSEYFQELEGSLERNSDLICDLNISLIQLLCKFLSIEVKFVLASQLDVQNKGGDLVLEICKKLNATVYLSGISGKEYLNLPDFKKENIQVLFQEFHHPIYQQLYEPFIPCLSTLDLIFNYGRESLDLINGKGVPVMEEVFL